MIHTRSSNTNPTKNWGDLRCSGKISNFCSISGNRRVNVRRSLNTSTIYFFRNQQQRWNHHAKYISTREYCFLGHVIFCQHHDHHMFLRNLLFFLILLSCLSPFYSCSLRLLNYLASKYFWFWTYLIKVIPEMHRAH